jgi:nicotinamidase/pyrazinamidase
MTDPSAAKISLKPSDALLVVDIQNDFLPGGALGVDGGDEIVPVLNRYVMLFRERDLPVFITRDWHTPGHCSFKAQGGIWPPHCVAGTQGAEFAPGFDLPPDAVVVSKATRQDKDAYSGFEGTSLEQRLRDAGVRRVFIGGLATDYCVLNTFQDALRLDFDVCVLRDAIRAVNVQPDDGQKAEEEMWRLGAEPVSLEMIQCSKPNYIGVTEHYP